MMKYLPLLCLLLTSPVKANALKAYIDTIVFLNQKGESVKVHNLRKSLQSSLVTFNFTFEEYAINAAITEEMRNKQLELLSKSDFDIMVITYSTFSGLVKNGAKLSPLYEVSDSASGSCQRTASLLKSTGAASKTPEYGIVGAGNPNNARLLAMSKDLKLKVQNFKNYQLLTKALNDKKIDGAFVYLKSNGPEKKLHPLMDMVSGGKLVLAQEDSLPLPCSLVVVGERFTRNDSLQAFLRTLSKTPEVSFHTYPIPEERQKKLLALPQPRK